MAGERTELIAVRLNEREMRIIERRAKAEGITISAYIRGAAMISAVMEGDFDAFKYVGAAAARAVAEKARRELEGGSAGVKVPA